MSYEQVIAAKTQILSIRRIRGIDDNDNLVEDPENWSREELIEAAKMYGIDRRQKPPYWIVADEFRSISHQLNSTDTHFVSELIQNADDTDYADGTLATIWMRALIDGTDFQFQSNEKGFRKENVEALCRLGRSSKKANPNTVGEKGIGFKSVFKAAKVAFIRSNAYSFKFDTEKLKDFGMLVPTWVPIGLAADIFAGSRLILAMKDGWNKNVLENELESFSPACLLFTRKIKRIEITIRKEDGRRAHTLRKDEESCLANAVEIVTSSQGNSDKRAKYLIRKYPVHNLPTSDTRPDAQRREIVIGLPYKDEMPQLQAQQTFAYLPIHDFGFQFLIHADFILTANREDIDQSPEWNRCLRKAIIPAFRNAVLSLCKVQHSRMAIEWPQYILCLQRLPPSFLKEIGQQILNDLQEHHLLLSEADTHRKPPQLMIVPSTFRCAGGNLLLDHDSAKCIALSKVYSTQAVVALHKALNVPQMSVIQFFKQYEEYTKRNKGVDFQHQPADWHIQIADVLSNPNYRSSKRTIIDICRNCRNIPVKNPEVRGGISWVSINVAEKVYFQTTDTTSIPDGLFKYIVDENAAVNPIRREFFSALGVSVCNRATVCQTIKNLHNNEPEPTFDLQTCISHATYLFTVEYEPDEDESLIFFDNKGTLTQSTTIYIPFGTDGETVSQMFSLETSVKVYHRLHSAYKYAVPEGQLQRWCNWLLQWEGLEIWPVLGNNGQLSQTMQHLLSASTSKNFLLCLRHRRLDKELYDRRDLDSISVIEQIKVAEVFTELGQKTMLKETALPSLRTHSQGLFPILELGGMKDLDWSFLKSFGVLTEPGFELHLRELCLYRRADRPPSNHQLRSIYSSLGSSCQHDDGAREKVRKHFLEQSLVYVEGHKWLAPNECVWKSQFPCAVIPVLSKSYPNCSHLFSKCLKVKKADLDTLVEELSSHAGIVDLDLSRKMLFALNEFLTPPSKLKVDHQTTLQRLSIFPVWRRGSGEARILRTICSYDSFWIPDSRIRYGRFEGQLWLLDVPSEDIVKLSHLIKQLGLENKLLSKAVTETRDFGDSGQGCQSEIDLKYTEALRVKVPYILRIIGHENAAKLNDSAFIKMLANLCVYRVEQIILRSVIVDGESKILGKEADGRALLDDSSPEGLRIYLQHSGHADVGMPTDLVGQMEEFLFLNQDSHNVFQLVMMESADESIREILEKQGIEQLAQCLPKSDSAANAAIEEGDDEYRSDSSSDTSSDGKPEDQRFSVSGPEIGIVQKTDYNHRHHKSMMGLSSRVAPTDPEFLAIPLPGDSSSPSRGPHTQRRSSTPRLSPAAPLENGPSVFDLFQAGNVEDKTPLVKQNSFAKSRELSASPSQHHMKETNPFDTTTLANALLSPSSTLIKSSGASTPGLHIPMYANNQNQRRRSGTSTSNEDVVDVTPWQREVGFHGELFVFKHLQKLLGSSFGYNNWTSRYRNRAFADSEMRQIEANYVDFLGKEKDHADFVFLDEAGTFGEYLSQRGRRIPRYKGVPILYHLEVKSAVGSLQEPFFMSNNQMDKAKRYTISGPSREVYVIIRVYDLDFKDQKAAKLYYFVDPWNLIFGGSLHLQTRDTFSLHPL